MHERSRQRTVPLAIVLGTIVLIAGVGCRRTVPPSLPTASENPVSRDSHPDRWSALRWEYRPLVVFAPSPDDPRIDAVRQRIAAQRTGFSERDMIEVVVTDRGVEIAGASVATPAAELRERFGVSPETFVILLVGKDGGEKERTTDLDSLDPWFARIDTMPMRRREMAEDRAKARRD